MQNIVLSHPTCFHQLLLWQADIEYQFSVSLTDIGKRKPQALSERSALEWNQISISLTTFLQIVQVFTIHKQNERARKKKKAQPTPGEGKNTSSAVNAFISMAISAVEGFNHR